MAEKIKTHHESMKKAWLKREKNPDYFREMQRLSVEARKRNKKLQKNKDLTLS